MLRGGASLDARSVGSGVAEIMLGAAKWSVHSHETFSPCLLAHSKAVMLLRVGYLLAASLEDPAVGFVDCWRARVGAVPNVVSRHC